METKVYTEYSDGSYLVAVIQDGKLMECPPIRISPPADWGGSMTLNQAIGFLSDIRRACEVPV